MVGIGPRGVHDVDVGFVADERCNAKETGLRVNGIQLAVWAVLHPTNVVANSFGFPAGNGWNQHCEVGFATS